MRRYLWLLALVAIAGCVSIPSSGPVHEATDGGDRPGTTVRYVPTRPANGASPPEIVRGFLDAMLAYPLSSATAAAFLTPEAAKSWKPSAGMRIYSRPEVSIVGARRDREGQGHTGSELSLAFKESARLDQQGRFTPVKSRSTQQLQVSKIEGEWRISNPPDGLLITDKFFEDYMRPFNVYFFDSAGRRLVPEVVHLATGDQLPSALMASLSGGPRRQGTEGEPAALRTYLPAAETLRPAVPLDSQGIATVAFTADLSSLSRMHRERLSAQIVWTLRQAETVNFVRISGADSTMTINGAVEQSIGSWSSFGPSQGPQQIYAISDNKVVKIVDGDAIPLKGPLGENAGNAVDLGVGDGQIAMVQSGRNRISLLKDDGGLVANYEGSGFLPPRFDGIDAWWLVDSHRQESRLRIVDSIGNRIAPGWGDISATSFAIAPGGGRYAVTAGDGPQAAVYVGAIRRDRDGRVLSVDRPEKMNVDISGPTSVDWVSETELAFLGNLGRRKDFYLVSIDGSRLEGGGTRTSSLLPNVGVTSLALVSGPEPAQYAMDSSRRLWRSTPGGSWNLTGIENIAAIASEAK